MAAIAYFEGTDSLILSTLVTNGISTLPVSNGWDNHGKYVNHLGKKDDISAVIGYIHKVIPNPGMDLKPGDILYSCRAYSIPVILVIPTGKIENAKKILGTIGDYVMLVAPDELLDETLKCLQ